MLTCIITHEWQTPSTHVCCVSAPLFSLTPSLACMMLALLWPEPPSPLVPNQNYKAALLHNLPWPLRAKDLLCLIITKLMVYTTPKLTSRWCCTTSMMWRCYFVQMTSWSEARIKEVHYSRRTKEKRTMIYKILKIDLIIIVSLLLRVVAVVCIKRRF